MLRLPSGDYLTKHCNHVTHSLCDIGMPFQIWPTRISLRNLRSRDFKLFEFEFDQKA